MRSSEELNINASSKGSCRGDSYMEFCSKCGSYLQKTKYGFLCPRCGNKVRADAAAPQMQTAKTNQSSPIYIADASREGYETVHQTCPKCGNTEAFRRLAGVLGEHAGVRSERTLKQFTCAKCGHRWSKST